MQREKETIYSKSLQLMKGLKEYLCFQKRNEGEPSGEPSRIGVEEKENFWWKNGKVICQLHISIGI